MRDLQKTGCLQVALAPQAVGRRTAIQQAVCRLPIEKCAWLPRPGCSRPQRLWGLKVRECTTSRVLRTLQDGPILRAQAQKIALSQEPYPVMSIGGTERQCWGRVDPYAQY